MRRVKGFTLMELLVVVAIMAALIAILVPALGKARQRAKNMQCMTNLRGMTQAFSIYVDTIGGQKNLPQFFLVRGIVPARQLICPQTQVVVIPTLSGPHLGSAFTTWAIPTPEYVYGSYAVSHFWARPAGTAGVYNRKDSINESIIPAFLDAANAEVEPDESDRIPLDEKKYTPTAQLGAMAMRRHGSTTNVSFGDEHVEAVKLEDLWTLRWRQDWKRFDPYPVPADWIGYYPPP